MTIPNSKLETAKVIAREHFAVEPEMKHIFLLEPVAEDDPREPVKLLEVVDGAIESWIEPVSFPPSASRGIHFASVIVELSPQEFARIDPENIPFGGVNWQLGPELHA